MPFSSEPRDRDRMKRETLDRRIQFFPWWDGGQAKESVAGALAAEVSSSLPLIPGEHAAEVSMANNLALSLPKTPSGLRGQSEAAPSFSELVGIA